MRKERLQINLLGKPEVWLDGVQLTNFSTAKTEALLYYLATTGQIHSRETLAGLLWSEMPEAKAKRNLSKSLTVLRRLLEPFILIESQRVGFDPDVAIALDVNQLSTISSEPDGEGPAIQTAVDLYRGAFLEGFYVKDAPDFEAWQLARREQLRETAIGLLEMLLQKAISQQDYAAGINNGRRLLTLDPWRESAHRHLMLLLARNGKHAAALVQYEQCCQILADELGVEPMAETTALYERIRTIRSSSVVALPYETTLLVGREDELAQIQRRLQNPDCRLLTITGLGGIGKTRLAVAAAHRVNQESALLFLNGVAFVSLAGVTNETAVPLTFANSLNAPISSATIPRQALLNFLKNQEMLLVVDNFEHLTAASELLIEILKTCPDVKLLVTSRTPLNLASEWKLDLEGLPIPPAQENDLETLRRYASVTMIVRCASQVNKAFYLTEENAALIGQLCRLVAGIPLALQLAANWLRMMSISAVLAELERDLDILATDMQDIPSRQRSMRAVFESTWQLLAEEERRALETLSVCRGGFTLEAATAIAGANVFLLRRIINRALLFQQEEGRYDIHPLTRQFAQQKLSASGEAETAVSAHSQYYLTWMTKQTPALLGMAPQTAINSIKKDLDNIEQAWLWAKQTRNTTLLLEGLMALATFCDVVGLLQAGEEIAESIILHVTEAHHPDEELLLCRGLITKGQFIIDQGKYELAATTLAQALPLAQRLQDEESAADIHHLYGRLLTDTGKYDEAKQHHQQALATHRRLSNDRKTAKILTNLGWTYIVADDVEAALPVLQEALTLQRDAGHKHGEAFAKGNLAVAYSIQGEILKALTHQHEVLAAYQELGDLLNIERSENNIGMSFLGSGQYKAAVPHVQKAVELSRQIGTVPGLANCLDTLGAAYLACGFYDKAKACLDEALEYALEIGFVYMKYSVWALLVKLYNRTGKLTLAEEHLQQLQPLAERLENTVYIARSLAEQAYLAYARGNLEEASELIRQAIDIMRQHSSQPDLPFFLLRYADYLYEQQCCDDAFALVQETITIAEKIQHEPLLMRANAQAANLAKAIEEGDTAQDYAETAVHFLRQLEPYPDTLTGLLHLSRYRFAMDDNEVALKISAFLVNYPATPAIVSHKAAVLQEETTAFLPDNSAISKPLGWDELKSVIIIV